jgi:hypothetical protein
MKYFAEKNVCYGVLNDTPFNMNKNLRYSGIVGIAIRKAHSVPTW